MTPHEQVRALVRAESARWVIRSCRMLNGRIQWALLEDGRLYGSWPDPKFVTDTRRRVIVGCIAAEVVRWPPVNSRYPAPKTLLRDGVSVEQCLRDWIIERWEEDVLRAMERMGQ